MSPIISIDWQLKKTCWTGYSISGMTQNKNNTPTLLPSIPWKKVDVLVEKEIVSQGEEWEMNITVSNSTEKLAFFIELMATKKCDGTSILPVFWSDNYISLPPDESKVLNLKFYAKDLGNDEPIIKIQGVNLKENLTV